MDAMKSSAELVWICRQCSRPVPKRIVVCRCGFIPLEDNFFATPSELGTSSAKLKVGPRPGAAKRRWWSFAQGGFTGVLFLVLAVHHSQSSGQPSTPIALASVEKPNKVVEHLGPVESPSAKPEHPERPPDADSPETTAQPRLDTSEEEDVASPDSPPSLEDVIREVLPAVFLASMYRLSKQANLIDSLWQQNRGRCLWRVSAGPTHGREWFEILGGVSSTWRRYFRREYRLDWSGWEY